MSMIKEEKMRDGGFGGCVTCECDQEVECVIFIVEMHVYPLSAKSKCIQMGKSRDENTYLTAHNRHLLCSAKVQGLTGSLIIHRSKAWQTTLSWVRSLGSHQPIERIWQEEMKTSSRTIGKTLKES